MNMPDASKQILAIVESLLLIGERALAIVRSLNLIKARTVPYSYENLLLEFHLDLTDPQGRRALLTRKQRVHFFTAEAGVLSSPVWGEGTQLRRFELTGATRLGARPDGSRQVLMLGLRRPAVKDLKAEVLSRQTMLDSFLREQEYMEAVVERPTKRLRLRAVFPKGRPPTDAYLSTSSGGQERLPVRIGQDGRARISWSFKQPTLDTVYSMRWAW
jgi:hypothetical protein